MTLDVEPVPVTSLPMRRIELSTGGARPLTVNRVADLHRQQWARHTKATRWAWKLLARANHCPSLDRARIVVTPLHRNGRSPQDVAACAPEAKAAIDGIVDAGVLPDDGPDHLLSVLFLPPSVVGFDGLQLVIEEAP